MSHDRLPPPPIRKLAWFGCGRPVRRAAPSSPRTSRTGRRTIAASVIRTGIGRPSVRTAGRGRCTCTTTASGSCGRSPGSRWRKVVRHACVGVHRHLADPAGVPGPAPVADLAGGRARADRGRAAAPRRRRCRRRGSGRGCRRARSGGGRRGGAGRRSFSPSCWRRAGRPPGPRSRPGWGPGRRVRSWSPRTSAHGRRRPPGSGWPPWRPSSTGCSPRCVSCSRGASPRRLGRRAGGADDPPRNGRGERLHQRP